MNTRTSHEGNRSKGVFIRLHRFIHGLDRDQGGQTIVLIGLILFSLALFFVLVVNTGNEVAKKFFIQNNADAAALSGASWQARFLNILSLINMVMAIILGIIIVLNAIKKALEIAMYILLGVWIGLQVCCAIPLPGAQACCLGAPFAQAGYEAIKEVKDAYDPIADEIMDALWEVLSVLSDIEDALVEISPYVPPIMANVVAYENSKAEDPSVSFLGLSSGNVEDSLGGVDLNNLGGIDIDTIVVCWPLPPELPIHEGGIEDVCNEVREYLDENITEPLEKYLIGYIIGPIIEACISVTCEGGDGSYEISDSEMTAAACSPATNPNPEAPDCQSIANGSEPETSLDHIEWAVEVKYYECRTECACGGGLCGNCTTEYNNGIFYSHDYETSGTNIPPMSGGIAFSEIGSNGVNGCGWKKYTKMKDREGDDDGDLAWNEDPINGIDDDTDGRTDEDPIIYLCKEEKWWMTKCNYKKTGTSDPPPGTEENSDDVQPYILNDDWQDNNTVFYFTHFKKGKSILLSERFKSPVRSTVGANAFASASFFCNDTDPSDCDMFHLNWKSKLVPIQEDSELLSGMPSFINDVIDVFITH